jgi:clan AA aspartic protease (TIGR02281 family)
MWWSPAFWDGVAYIALGVFGACTVWQCTDKPSSASVEPRPPIARPENGREIVASGSPSDGCYIEARANGEMFRFLLDTGSSGALTFGSNHAKRLGIEQPLNFDRNFDTANGVGKGASVRLREFRIGDSFVVRDVRADITQAAQSVPLLGVELLHRLSLRLRDGKCILTVPEVARAASVRPMPPLPPPPPTPERAPIVARGTGGLY